MTAPTATLVGTYTLRSTASGATTHCLTVARGSPAAIRLCTRVGREGVGDLPCLDACPQRGLVLWVTGRLTIVCQATWPPPPWPMCVASTAGLQCDERRVLPWTAWEQHCLPVICPLCSRRGSTSPISLVFSACFPVLQSKQPPALSPGALALSTYSFRSTSCALK